MRRGWLVIPCCSPRTGYPFPHSHAHVVCTSRQVGSPFSLLVKPASRQSLSTSPPLLLCPFQFGRPPPATWPIVWTACMHPRGLGALDCEGDGHSVALPSLQANQAALEQVRGLKVELGRGCCLPGPSGWGVCLFCPGAPRVPSFLAPALERESLPHRSRTRRRATAALNAAACAAAPWPPAMRPRADTSHHTLASRRRSFSCPQDESTKTSLASVLSRQGEQGL